jgi:peptidoglycan hydrolase-like protein with peptidoglycan-binding domain
VKPRLTIAGYEPGRRSSEYVRWVQSALNRAMGLQLVVDGVMGRETRSAIRSFQERNGLPADGIVGPDTERALIEAGKSGAPPAPADQPADARGDPSAGQAGAPPADEAFAFDASEWDEGEGEVNRSSRDYIRWVQQSLNQILGTRLAVDGVLGPLTRSAVRSFQQRYGLAVDGIVGPITEAALQAALGGASPQPPQPQPSTPSGGTYGPGSALRQNAVTLALGEWARWNFGQTKESDPTMRAALEEYWQAGTGSVPGTANWWSNLAWSAVFISWVMRNAGAGSDFRYSSAHTDYVGAAKQNRLANNSNPFKAYRVSEVAPRPGDLICVERQDADGNWSGVTYDNVDQGFRASHCDIVTEVSPGQIKAIGGNVSDSVSEKTVRTDANGRVSEPRYYAIVRVGD